MIKIGLTGSIGSGKKVLLVHILKNGVVIFLMQMKFQKRYYLKMKQRKMKL